MKIVSDSQVVAHLLKSLTRGSILNGYQPVLMEALKNFEADLLIVPDRTVQVSSTIGSDATHLFMPCIAPHGVGVKVISGGPSNSKKGLGFQGCLVILDEYTGELQAVVNGKALTAFRTGLASSLGLVRALRIGTDILPELLVFGAGPQAFWHILIAARLYGDKIRRINVISRSLDSAEKLAASLEDHVEQPVYGLALGSAEVETHVQNSSIIFGCTPSTEGIILKKYINSDPSRIKFILLIGSYKPHMLELDLDFLSEHYTGKGTKIVVDSKSNTLSEAGELIQGKIGEEQLVSLTEMDTVDGLDITTKGGVVVQKLGGLLIMDVCMAKYLMEQVEGTVVEEF